MQQRLSALAPEHVLLSQGLRINPDTLNSRVDASNGIGHQEPLGIRLAALPPSGLQSPGAQSISYGDKDAQLSSTISWL